MKFLVLNSTFFLSILLLSLTCSAQNQIDLIGAYPFSSDANDISGNGLDGLVNGATLTQDRFGNASSAYLFDGIDDYISIPSSDLLDSISTDLTVCAWVNPNNQFYNSIVGKGQGAFFFQLAKYQRPGVKLTGITVDFTGAEDYYTRLLPFDSIPVGQWSHIAFTYSESLGQISIYVNGIEIHQADASGQIDSGIDDLWIGARNSVQYAEFFSGSLDEILIYGRALTSSEIDSIGNSSIPLASDLYMEENEGFSLHPNPAKHQINLSLDFSGYNSKITISTIDGQIVKSILVSDQKTVSFDTSKFSSGLYIVSIENGGKVYKDRLVIQ